MLAGEPEGSSPMMSQSSRSGISGSGISIRPYVSKVGILPSSIPTYHKDFMDRQKSGDDSSSTHAASGLDEPSLNRTDAEKQEMVRRLKPHSRSQLRIDEAAKRPQGMTPVHPPKKTKPVRWQFGIRSRNAPWEALLTIHKALRKLGATYVPDEDFESNQGRDSEGAPSGSGSFADNYDGGPLSRDSGLSTDPAKKYKLPADPWHIKVRWDTSSKRCPPVWKK